MTIDVGAAIDVFGITDTIDSTAAAVVDGAFSAGITDIAAWTNDDDAPMGRFQLTFQYSTGTLGSSAQVPLYARLLNIDGSTGDAPVPDASYPYEYLGSFRVDPNLAVSTDDNYWLDAPLPNGKTSQEYEFYIRNMTGVDFVAGWKFRVTPKTIAPKP